MKTKILIGLIAGILLLSLTAAGMLSANITPRDSTLDTKLSNVVTDRLDDEFRNVEWENEVTFVDDEKAFGTLTWEWNNGTAWLPKSKRLNLWIDYEVEAGFCIDIVNGTCVEKDYIPVEDFLDERMLKASDKYFMKTYNKLPDVVDIRTEDVGEKIIKLKRISLPM